MQYKQPVVVLPAVYYNKYYTRENYEQLKH